MDEKFARKLQEEMDENYARKLQEEMDENYAKILQEEIDLISAIQDETIIEPVNPIPIVTPVVNNIITFLIENGSFFLNKTFNLVSNP